MVDIQFIIDEACNHFNFNPFRQFYDQLTFSQKKEINFTIFKRYPEQNFSNKNFFLDSFEIIHRELGDKYIKVCEFGGFDGTLAKTIMDKYPDTMWVNYDLANVPPVKGLENRPYKLVELMEPFPNNGNLSGFNVFVSSDALEHINIAEFMTIYNALLSSNFLYYVMQIDVRPGKTDWTNYGGTHVLTLTHEDLNKMFEDKKLLLERPGSEWKRLYSS